MNEKFAILPCTGIGQVLGTISRQAAYLVCDELRPDNTLLVCLPALVKGIEEDLDMIRDYPVVVIEGCRDRCATHALTLMGGKVKGEVFVPSCMRRGDKRISDSNRGRLSEAERELVSRVGHEVVRTMDRLQESMNMKVRK